MMIPNALRRLASLWVLAAASAIAADTDGEVEALIEQLTEVAVVGNGYSTFAIGTGFLPAETSDYITMEMRDSGSPPQRSKTLEAIVRKGIHAVPALLKHMDDARPTAIPLVMTPKPMLDYSYYDVNRRTRKDIPQTWDNSALVPTTLTSHRITVGDLCFVALGQIVNRSFNAVHGMGDFVSVSSPPRSKRLCEVIRKDFGDLDQARHRALLTEDFNSPDASYRRNYAYLRLATYYPETVEPLVLRQLKLEPYDETSMRRFLKDEVYPETNFEVRKKRFDNYTRGKSPEFRDGLLLSVFFDLMTLDHGEDARAVLVQMYGYKPSVRLKDRPVKEAWSDWERAAFIKNMTLDASPAIDAAVLAIFRGIVDDDRLALACMTRLAGRGNDELLREYCVRRKGKEKFLDREFDEILKKLGPANGDEKR